MITEKDKMLADTEALEGVAAWLEGQELKINIGQVQGDFDEHIESSAGWLLRLVKAALASPPLTQQGGESVTAEVRFVGVNPFGIGHGAVLPMIPDSWRFGFYRSGNELCFGYQDNGPLVAYAAALPQVGEAKAVAINGVLINGSIKRFKDADAFVIEEDRFIGVSDSLYAVPAAQPLPVAANPDSKEATFNDGIQKAAELMDELQNRAGDHHNYFGYAARLVRALKTDPPADIMGEKAP